MFKGMGGLGDMAKMMKSAQEMQGKVTQLQEDLKAMEVVGESGAGLVKAKFKLSIYKNLIYFFKMITN